MKTSERAQARGLRHRDGLSIKEIARRVGVSTSSVSLWVRDIKLTNDQEEDLRSGNPIYNRQLSGRAVLVERRRAERLSYQEQGRALARRGDILHAAGCMLYWGEGTKCRNQVRFSNSDPEMTALFVAFLRRYFDVRERDMRVTCHLYADHRERQREIERFWLEKVCLPEGCLCPSIVNVRSKASARKRLNMLPFGTCRVAVSRTAIVQSIFGSIQEYGGFERPEWLDC